MVSLADWDMSSGRNPFASHLPSYTAGAASRGRRLANGRAKARLLIKHGHFKPALTADDRWCGLVLEKLTYRLLFYPQLTPRFIFDQKKQIFTL